MSAYLRQVLQDSPSGYWPLSEVSGSTFFDRSGNSRNGTLTGTPTGRSSSGPGGMPALNLASSNAYVTVADNAAFSATSFTLEAWFNPSASMPSSGAVINKWFDPNIEWTFNVETLTPKTYIGSTAPGTYRSLPSSAALVVGQWYHLVSVYASGSAVIHYQNAVDVSGTPTGPTGTRVGDTSQSITIGAYSDGTVNLKGAICNVAYYGAALSSARIIAHYEAGIRAGVSY